MDILKEIAEHKRAEIAEKRRRVPLSSLQETAAEQPKPDFISALLQAPGGMALIAEVKQRSPSRGMIRRESDLVEAARKYEQAGVQAISVLVDRKYFGGGEELFQEVRKAVQVPLLYKEFVVDTWQIWHAASLGASAVLLIVALYSDDVLRLMLEECRRAGVTALVEVHDQAEMQMALRLKPECVGINNRNLKTLEVSLDTTRRLIGQVPASVIKVSESGIRDGEAVRQLRDLGVQAVLVGEHLLLQDDPGIAARRLMSEVWGSS